MLSTSNSVLFARASLGLIFLWIGAMNFTPVGQAIIGGWVSGHPFLSSLDERSIEIAWLVGLYQIILALLIAAPIPSGSFRRIGFGMLGVHALLALTALLTNPVWIESAGGFPAIGAGQGVLKYLAILGLAMWAGSFDNARMFSSRDADMRTWGRPVMVAGLILVLVWIGGMKFTAVEAAGIEPLLQTSLLFAWALNFLDIQTISNIIGVIELVTALALTAYWFNPRLFSYGLLAAGFTFVLTLSFMITFPASWDADLGGFPALGRAGHFLIKDLALLAACYALASENRPGMRRRRT